MRQLRITSQITERTHITDRYLSDIAPIDLITPEREMELARLIKKGDKNAENELVRANLRFVVSCAKQYQNRGIPLDDLINEGNIGLIKAAQRFDETRGFKFISYAVSWIRQAILESIHRNSRTVRLPSNKIQQLNRLRDISSKLAQNNDGVVSINEVCAEMGIDIQTYSILISGNASVSMDQKISEDNDMTMYDFMKDEDSNLEINIGQMSMKKQIKMAMGCLNEFEKDVILNIFGLNKEGREMSLGEIAEKNSYSSERIRQIKQKALTKMKKHLVFQHNMKTIEI